jgi:SAM-dependent methyltransferase
VSTRARNFYNAQFREHAYAQTGDGRTETAALAGFVDEHGLRENARVLEVGCGRAAFHELAGGWIGIDVAETAARGVGKPFVVASATSLPFPAGAFDGLWSVAVLEHVPEPEAALVEIARVLRPGGVAYLAPAWHCRPWAAAGIHLRRWPDLRAAEKLIRLTIPLREALWFRAASAIPARLIREMALMLFHRPTRFRYRRLAANYEAYPCTDSDACASMDPHEMLSWFVSRGWTSPSHPDRASRLIVRHGAIVVKKPMDCAMARTDRPW